MALKENRDDVISAIQQLRKEGYRLTRQATSFIEYNGFRYELKDVRAKELKGIETRRKEISVNQLLREAVTSQGLKVVDSAQ